MAGTKDVRRFGVLFAVLLLALLVATNPGAAQVVDTYWKHDPGTPRRLVRSPQLDQRPAGRAGVRRDHWQRRQRHVEFRRCHGLGSGLAGSIGGILRDERRNPRRDRRRRSRGKLFERVRSVGWGVDGRPDYALLLGGRGSVVPTFGRGACRASNVHNSLFDRGPHRIVNL